MTIRISWGMVSPGANSLRRGVARRPAKTLALLVATALLAVPAAHGGLLLYEPFDYPASGLDGKGGDETGFKANSKWQAGSGGGMNVKSGSLTFRDLPTAGGKAALTRASTSNTNLLAKRKLGFTLGSGEDLWTSYLVKRANTTNDNSAGKNAYGIAVDDNSYSDGSRRFATLASQKWASNNPAYLKGLIDYNARGNTRTNPTNSSSKVNTTYLVIGKFQDLGTSGATAKLWIVRTSEVTSIDQILTEAALSAEVPNAFEGSAVLDPDRSASITAGDFLYLYGFGGKSSKKRRFQVQYDEVRMGTDLPSVLGVVPVPEPASLLLLVWSLPALTPLALRRRRRR